MIGASQHFATRYSGLECVVNISEGRRGDILESLAQSVSADDLLDVHVDPWHHRSVWTLLGVQAPRLLARRAIDILHLGEHQGGVHPRLGVVDVVPFVPLGTATVHNAVTARDEFAQWISHELGIPSFLYGPTSPMSSTVRTLPDIRRRAWNDLRPDWGPDSPHSTAGAVCVGARLPMVAYNIWLRPGSDWTPATEITATIRSPKVRALTLQVDKQIQISLNLVEPMDFGPADVYDQVQTLGAARGIDIDRAELVGLIPRAVLDVVPDSAQPILDLSPQQTIEFRIEHGFQFTAP